MASSPAQPVDVQALAEQVLDLSAKLATIRVVDKQTTKRMVRALAMTRVCKPAHMRAPLERAIEVMSTALAASKPISHRSAVAATLGVTERAARSFGTFA